MIDLYINGTKQSIVNGEINPTFTDAKDLTYQTFQCELAINDNPNPIAPKQPAQIKIGSNVIADLITWSDEVKIFSLTPKKYKHTLTLVERKKLLEDVLLRNIVLSQLPSRNIYCETYDLCARIQDLETEEYEYFWGYYNRTANGAVYQQNAYKSSVHISNNIANKHWRLHLHTYAISNNSISDWDLRQYRYRSTQFQVSINGMVINIDAYTDFNNADCYKDVDMSQFAGQDVSIESNIEWGSMLDEEMRFRNKIIQTKIVLELVDDTNYTMLERLQEIQKIARKEVNSKNFGFNFNIPTSGELYNLLTHTIAPNFSFTQATLYQALQEVFNYYDATFTLDSNNNLGIRYLNETTQRTISEQGISGLSALHEGSKYSNGLLTFFENTEIEEYFPSKRSYGKCRSNVLGVPVDGEVNFITPREIKILESVKTKGNVSGRIPFSNVARAGTFNISFTDIELELNDRITRQDLWSLFSTDQWVEGTNRYDEIKQANTTYYSGNEIKMQLKTQSGWRTDYQMRFLMKCELAKVVGVGNKMSFRQHEHDYILNLSFTPDITDLTQVAMQVKYITSMDGRLQIESLTKKANGVELNNQSQGIVDINKLGQSMLGLSLKLGEPSKTIKTEITNWNDRLQVGDKTSDNYIANQVCYEFLNNKIVATAQLTKNFNALASRIPVDTAKRLSNISSDLAQKCEDNIVQYVYYGTSKLQGDSTIIHKADLQTILLRTFNTNAEGEYIDFAQIATYDKNNSLIISNVVVPFYAYGTGNSLCFEVSYTHPLNAGNSTTKKNSGWWGENVSYFTNSVKYADENGTFDSISIWFKIIGSGSFTDYPKTTGITSATTIFTIGNFIYNKQPNEIFALNYQLCFVPITTDNKVILGNAFFTNSGINKKKVNFKLYSSSLPYDLFDNTKRNEDVEMGAISITGSAQENEKITFKSPVAISTSNKNFAIIGSDNNIYIAFNGISDTIMNNGYDIYFSILNERN